MSDDPATGGLPDTTISVEVAYATPEKQLILSLCVPCGTSMYEAVERSEIREHFPEIDLEKVDMGIFGKLEKNPKSRVLKPLDRVEIYRPLLIDPKAVRKKRAEEAKNRN
ncbi:MAG: RnfH family protein [Gammaproteobacteria bacterium]